MQQMNCDIDNAVKALKEFYQQIHNLKDYPIEEQSVTSKSIDTVWTAEMAKQFSVIRNICNQMITINDIYPQLTISYCMSCSFCYSYYDQYG